MDMSQIYPLWLSWYSTELGKFCTWAAAGSFLLLCSLLLSIVCVRLTLRIARRMLGCHLQSDSLKEDDQPPPPQYFPRGTLAFIAGILERINSKLFWFLSILHCLAIAVLWGAAIYLWYSGETFDATKSRLSSLVSWQQSKQTVFRATGLFLLLIVALWIRKKIGVIASRISQSVQNADSIEENDRAIQTLFIFIGRLAKNLAFVAVILTGFSFDPNLASATPVLRKLAVIYSLVELGLLASKALGALIVTLEVLVRRSTHRMPAWKYVEQALPLLPFLKIITEYSIYILLLTFGFYQFESLLSLSKYGPHLVRVLYIGFAARVLTSFVAILMEEALLKGKEPGSAAFRARQSILPLVTRVLNYLVYFGAAILMLRELGINPVPVLAGAGILGFAVGLGAQNFISDLVSGFSILIEDLFLVGDYVKILSVEGHIEHIDLSVTRLRDNSGRLHIFRNGKIEGVVNYSREFVYATVTVGVAYESDLDKVYKVLECVGEKLQSRFPELTKPIEVRGLDSFGESDLVIQVAVKAPPGSPLKYERLLRKEIKEAFDFENIEIPYPRRFVIQAT